MRYIIDTNVLLDYPQIVEDTTKELMIPSCVLRELDGLKLSLNADTAFNARRAAIYLSHNLDSLIWIDEDIKNIPVDEQLLSITEKNNGILLTNDIYLKVKAKFKNIPTEGYSHKDDYDGVIYWHLNVADDENYNILENLLEAGEIPEHLQNMNENQYLIIKDTNNPIVKKGGINDFQSVNAFVRKGDKLKQVERKAIKNQWINKIFPRNSEQECLFDALQDRNNTIVHAGGRYGSGKSYIINNFALQELEKETIKKIVYIPNNSYVDGAMELGYLPGSDLEKIIPSIGPLIDLIGLDYVNKLILQEKLEIVPLGYIRGRSFQDAIIIVNEAQNLTEDHLKLLIARCGEGSRIFFDGDIKQADSQLFRNKNGLKLLSSLRKSPVFSRMFAMVKLTDIERSLTAQAADYLDTF